MIPGRDAWFGGFIIMVCLGAGIGFGSLGGSSSRYGSTQASIDSLIESQRRIQELQRSSLALQDAAALQKTLDSLRAIRQPALDAMFQPPASSLPPACLPPDEIWKATREAEAAIERRVEPADVCEPID